MVKKSISVGLAGLLQIISLLMVLPAFADEVPRLTREQVKAMLGKRDVTVIDVRANAVQPGDLKIAGAAVEDPKKVENWAKTYSKNKTLILYCA